MFYNFRIVTPLNTSYANRLKTTLRLAKGTISQVSIFFPKTCDGMLRLQIFHGANQVYPFNTGEFFNPENETIPFNDDYELSEPPFELVAHTWNLDSNFSHSVHIRLNVTPISSISRIPKTGRHFPSLLKKLGI